MCVPRTQEGGEVEEKGFGQLSPVEGAFSHIPPLHKQVQIIKKKKNRKRERKEMNNSILKKRKRFEQGIQEKKT